MSTEIRYLVAYGSYMSRTELGTIVLEANSIPMIQARIENWVRVFNLPHGSFRYPITGNLKGVLNAVPRQGESMNVLLIPIPNIDTWVRLDEREGTMYEKVTLPAIVTENSSFSNVSQGDTIEAIMYIGKEDRIKPNLYPLPEYYKLVRKAVKTVGDAFFEEFLESTYLQANGAFLTCKEYEANVPKRMRPDKLTRITGLRENLSINNRGVKFKQIKNDDRFELERDYYMEEIAKNIIHNESTHSIYKFLMQHQKIEFYRATLVDPDAFANTSIWTLLEQNFRGIQVWDSYFDPRTNTPLMSMNPFKIVLDRNLLKFPSLVAQTLAQIILGVMNPMTLQPWTDSGGVQMMWKHYMSALLASGNTVERMSTKIVLLTPEFVHEWEPGMSAGAYDNFLPTFDALTAINAELVVRRELIEFPIYVPRNIENDYRTSRSDTFWKQWVWFYSKWDRTTNEVFTYAKFEETVDRRDFIQLSMSNTPNCA